MEKIELDSSNKINSINLKLMKMDESSVIQAYVEDEILNSKKAIQYTIDRVVEDFDIKLYNLTTSHLNVPDLIGEGLKFPKLTDFTHHLSKGIEKLELFTDDLYSKISKVKIFSENKVNQSIQKSIEDLVQHIKEEISTSSNFYFVCIK